MRLMRRQKNNRQQIFFIFSPLKFQLNFLCAERVNTQTKDIVRCLRASININLEAFYYCRVHNVEGITCVDGFRMTQPKHFKCFKPLSIEDITRQTNVQWVLRNTPSTSIMRHPKLIVVITTLDLFSSKAIIRSQLLICWVIEGCREDS